MKVKVFIEEIETVKIDTSNLQNFDSIILDKSIELQLGKDGIKELMHNLIWNYNHKYGEDELVELLQDQDFNSVRELLVEGEVSELDKEIRELKKDLKEANGNYDIAMNLLNALQEGK